MKLFLFLSTFVLSLSAQTATHYDVKLTPDLTKHILRGVEDIRFTHAAGFVDWVKQPGMEILKSESPDGDITTEAEKVRITLKHGGAQTLHVEYTAPPARGFSWPSDQQSFDTAFYCEAWMVCDNSPGQRATLRLEVILPQYEGWNVVGPGDRVKGPGPGIVYEQKAPVQTYLFSFGVAKLKAMTEGKFTFYAADDDHVYAYKRSLDAWAYIRGLATVDPLSNSYSQGFLPQAGLGQEAAGMALMSAEYLTRLEEDDSIYLMAHEMAHQWWGVTLGIKSWSDFWLNEGMAEFIADNYVRSYAGRPQYLGRLQHLEDRMAELKAAGKDRPLHWDGWKDAQEALGELPYVKGALFLETLRAEIGDRAFWTGLGRYTAKYAGQLVDARDFQKAMEAASGKKLTALFDAGVFH